MTNASTTNYVAIIQIHLPKHAAAVSANITLTPTELVPLDGNHKTLHECTLTELQAFADQLEAEIWETYQEIKLADLAKDSSVKMAMDVVDAAGEPVAPSREWLAKMVVETAVSAQIDEESEESEEIDDGSELESEAVIEETADQPEPNIELEPEPAASVAEVEDKIDNDAITQDTDNENIASIIVSEPEPVHEEREAPPAADESETVIAPSQARVRIAGGHLPIGD
ncbi:MAG: hypothetical protein GY805_01730, partial [Chloroflexi bacterium]|nr:hypothetical protein [Chloroflexota bacterium]